MYQLNTITPIHNIPNKDMRAVNEALNTAYESNFHSSLRLAFRFATNLALKLIHHIDYNTIEIWEKVFVLLAIRHNDNMTMKNFVLGKIYKLLQTHPTNALLLRFLQATIWDIHKMKQSEGYKALPHPNTNIFEDFEYLLVQPTINDNYDTAKIFKKLLSEFTPIISTVNELNEVFPLQEGESNTHTFTLSISGGVDSMVASYLMKIVCQQNDIQMRLVHICYNNRKHCKDEIKFLSWWSAKLNVPLFVRSIDEIKRKRSNQYREMYETITRRIRISVYEYFGCPVILGHNKDDCIENIFSNLSKNIHFNNLTGMRAVSLEENVCMLRPLLNISKQTIVDFAANNHIPYLEDSTPSWSQRGQMRDMLIPQINKFNPNIINGLIQFSRHTKFLYDQWFDNFKHWKDQNVSVESNNMIIIRDEFFDINYRNLDFWIQICFMTDLLFRPSNKSLTHLMDCIRYNKLTKLTLSKFYDAIIDDDMIHFIYTVR